MTTQADQHAPTAVEHGLPDVGGPSAAAPAAGLVGGPDIVAVHQAQAPTPSSIRTVGTADVPSNRRRGGDVRTVLAPSTVGSTTGFMGTLTLQPGEFVTEHWHPYSEEFLFCVTGELTVRLDGEPRTLTDQQGVCIPIGVRHRLQNDSDAPVFVVFQLAPLAPQPRLGHVDTETLPGAAA